MAGVVFAAGDGAGGGGGGDQRGGGRLDGHILDIYNGSAGQTAPAFPLSRPSSDSFLAFMAYESVDRPRCGLFPFGGSARGADRPLGRHTGAPRPRSKAGAATLAAPYRTYSARFLQ